MDIETDSVSYLLRLEEEWTWMYKYNKSVQVFL